MRVVLTFFCFALSAELFGLQDGLYFGQVQSFEDQHLLHAYEPIAEQDWQEDPMIISCIFNSSFFFDFF